MMKYMKSPCPLAFRGARLIFRQAKGLTSPEDLAVRLQRCTVAPGGPGGPERYAPKPEPDIPGATDSWNCEHL